MTGNPPATLREVKSWMSFWGWTNDGGPGAMKFDADNKIIAYHGDAMWVADVEEASAKIDRLAAASRGKGRGRAGGGGRRRE
jgi:hypothetical protein